MFSVRGFEALFPHTGALGCTVCLIPQLVLLVYMHVNVGPPSLPAATLPTLVLQLPPCHKSSRTWLPISAPPTGLDECFFFNSLVVRLPYSSIFVSSGHFFILNLLSFFLLCKEAKCIYLCLHLGWKSKKNFFFKILFIYFREGKGGRKKGRETSMYSCLLCAPCWGPGLQPRHVP